MSLPQPTRDASPHRRLRWAMHGALTLIALLLAAAGWNAWQSELRRSADAELINLAGAQRMLSQRVALLAVQPPSDGGITFDAALERAQLDALRIEHLLGNGNGAQLDPLLPAQGEAVRRWQAARERLWYRAHTLARLQTSLTGPQGTGAATAGPALAARLTSATALLQREVDASLAAAQSLVEQIQLTADQKAARALRDLSLAAGLGAALLLALAAGVVEPASRFVRRQHARQSELAAHLEPLSLVARHTHNMVVITDARRRVAWVNDAFSRLTGYTLAEAQGRKPAELLQSRATDPATVLRMRAAMDAGLGVRVELINRNKAGREYWLDIDIRPLHDGNGALTGFIAVQTDVTEQVFQRLRLRTLLDALPTGVVEHDASGAIVDANRAAERVLGLSLAQLQGRHPVDPRWRTVHDDLSPYPGEQHPSSRSLRDGVSVAADSIGVMTAQDEQRWLLVNSEPLRNPAGELTGAVACFVDVTEQRAQRTLLQLALRAARIGTWDWRLDTDAPALSAESCALLGYSVDEFEPLRQAWREQVHPDDQAGADRLLRQHLAEPSVPYRCDMRLRHRSGAWVWVQFFGSVVERGARGRAQRMVGIHLDISERKLGEQQLQATALTDALTGLPNRSALLQRLTTAIDRHRAAAGGHFGLLFLDFDRFKQVNDSLGHSAGDDLLRQIAHRLQGTLRPGDAVSRPGEALDGSAARLGGDEFVVLLDGLAEPADAALVAERLLQVLARPYDVLGHRVFSSASIGVRTSALAFDDADSLLRDADTAMYEAKQGGRGRWVLFEPRMRQQVSERAGIEADLHLALERAELFVVYQPVLDLVCQPGRPGCAGVEALVRWRHPTRGVVSPAQFVPVAEECGLIGALGLFVLQTACGQFMRWQRELGALAPGLLAVNLSVAQLRQGDLMGQVQQILTDNGMPPAALQLEVTESLAAQDPVVQARLRELKSLGLKLALDDFGTGYSSLACLHLLPVDTVKIDRSFVVEAEHSDYHRALIDATVRVARTLHMTTVAEGIETPDQAAQITALGCDRGQGYLFCRPLEPAALRSWLTAHATPALTYTLPEAMRTSGRAQPALCP